MSQQKAKVFARFFGYQVPASLPAGQTTDQNLSDDLREALAAYLSQRFTPEHFRSRDIIGYSV
jgi:hypothetical protein